MTGVVAQVGVQPFLNWLGSVLGVVPRLVLALVVLVLAYFVGGWVGGKLQALAARMDLGEAVLETPLAVVFEGPDEVGNVLETTTQYLFLLFGVVVGASIAGFDRIFGVGEYLVRYLPSVIGAILVVLVGFVVAGYVARSVKASDVVGDYAFSPLLATTLKAVIYFVVVTLALDALGYSTAILNTLAQAVAIGVGLGVALAIGIGVGLGSQDYVADHVDDWVGE